MAGLLTRTAWARRTGQRRWDQVPWPDGITARRLPW
jgi:hypothetical protein